MDAELDLLESLIREICPLQVVFKPQSSFVQLGLDSLLLATLENRVRLFYDLPFGFLLRHPTPRSLADALKEVAGTKSVTRSRKSNLQDERKSVVLDQPVNRRYPLSRAQKRLWFELLSTEVSVFDETVSVTVPGLNHQKLKKSFELISAKCNVLRTSVTKSFQVVLDDPVPFSELHSRPLIDEKVPIQISFQSGDTFIFRFSHLLLDGKSVGLIMTEMLNLYYGNPGTVIDGPSYVQFVEWEYSQNEEVSNEDIAFWKDYLRDVEINDDSPDEYACDSVQTAVNAELFGKVLNLIEECGITMNTLHVAITTLIMNRLYPLDDVVIGIPVDRRPDPAFETTPGLFLNQIFFKNEANEALNVLDYLKSTSENLRTVLSHSTGPLDLLAKEVKLPRVNTLVVDDKVKDLPDGVSVNTHRKSSPYLMTFYLRYDKKGRSEVILEYNKKYKKDQMDMLMEIYARLLEFICGDKRSKLMSFQTCEVPTIYLGTKTENDFVANILTNLRGYPSNKVVIKSTTNVTAAQFMSLVDEQVNQLMKYESDGKCIVGLLMHRSIELVVGVIAAWVVGLAPLILDPDWPEADWKQIREEFVCLLTEDDFQKSVTSKNTGIDQKRSVRPRNQLGYCAFTSGSTGQRRLIKCTFDGLSNLLEEYRRLFEFGPNSVTYQVVNPAFDIFYADLVCTFCCGGTLVLARGRIPSVNEIEENNVTHAYIMPAYLNKMPDNDILRLRGLRFLLFGGDRISARFISQAIQCQVNMCQLFGFTEHAIYTNYQLVGPGFHSSFIGKPFKNTLAYCGDKAGRPMPSGFSGHLYTGGVGLSLADSSGRYVNTAHGYVYSTGDVCQLDPETNRLMFLGRSDDTRKVNGHMINLKHLDECIESMEEIEISISVCESESSDEFIETYIKVYDTNVLTDESKIREHLVQKLPFHYQPRHLYFLRDIPLSCNGKVDKSKLRKSKQVDVTYNGNVEDVLQRTFGDEIDMDTDLLAHGVDSLKLLELVQEMESQCNFKLNLKDIFKARTLRKWMEMSRNGVTKAHFIQNLNGNHFTQQKVKATYNLKHVWILKNVSSGIGLDNYDINILLQFFHPIQRFKLDNVIQRLILENDALRIKTFVDDGDLYIQTKENGNVVVEYLDDFKVKLRFKEHPVDGHSLKMLVRSLASYYSGLEEHIRKPSFLDFAQWESEQSFEVSLRYWAAELKGHLNLGTHLKDLRTETKPARISGRVKVNNNTTYTTFQLILFAYIWQTAKESQPTIVGIPFQNRSNVFKSTVGYLANTLPVKFNYIPNPTDQLAHIQETMLRAMQHSDVPFPLLVQQLKPARHLDCHPIFQTMISYEDFSVDQVPGLFEVEEICGDTVKLDQCWYFWHKNDELQVKIEFDEVLFSKDDMSRSFNEWLSTFESALSNDSIRNGRDTLGNHPSTPRDISEQVLEMYRKHLRNAQFDVNDNFFDFGGHSLTAVMLANDIGQVSGLEISVRDIFKHQTPAELVHHLVQRSEYSFEVGDKVETIPFTMEALLICLHRAPKSVQDAHMHHIRLDISQIPKELVMQRLKMLINSQQVLRTAFSVKNGQVNANVMQAIDELKLPFTISSSTFATVNIYMSSETLDIHLHHVCADGHSMQVMMRTLNGEVTMPSSLEESANLLNEDFKDKDVTYWEDLLPSKSAELFKDNHNIFGFDQLSMSLNREDIVNKCKELRVPPSTFLMYSLHETLQHWTQEPDESLLIGLVTDLRGHKLRDTMGHFCVTLPIPRCAEIDQLDDTIWTAKDHAACNVADVIARGHLGCDVMLVVDNEPAEHDHLIETDDVVGKALLTFFVTLGNVVQVKLVYSRCWKRETVDSMLDTIRCILRGDDIPEPPSLNSPVPFADPINQVMTMAQRSPHSIAIRSTRQSLSYDDLSHRIVDLSARLSLHYLRMFGAPIKADNVIAVICGRSVDALLLCLAVMWSGAAYLPIDRDTPTSRVETILKRSGAKICINSTGRQLGIVNVISVKDLSLNELAIKHNCYTKIASCGRDLGYVIFTSGSSGQPKAVAIPRSALANTLEDARHFMDVNPSDVILQFTKLCFDNSVLEIFLALTSGASLFMDEEEFDPNRFSRQISQFDITHAFLFPGLVETFSREQLQAMSQLKYWIVGAEPLGQSLLDRALDAGVRVIQNYGPTETTCYALRSKLGPGQLASNLGTPVGNARIRLGCANTPPHAAPRPLWIAGAGLMRGYLGPRSECFVPWAGASFYRTGDLVRLNGSGQVLFHGRRDAQVKVRGFRVDLREVELTLGQVPGMGTVKVIKDRDSIVAFYTSQQNTPPSDLRQHCKRHLPSYMIPSLFYKVEEIPLTANNKVDTNKLKDVVSQVGRTSEPESVITETDHRIVKEWETQLHYSEVKVEDNFFEAGGNSLTAMEFLDRLRTLGLADVSLTEFYNNPTLKFVMESKNMTKQMSSSVTNKVKPQFGPLSFQQEQMIFLESASHDFEYNLVFVQRFDFSLNLDKLEMALTKLMEDHWILRTIYYFEGSDFKQKVVDTPLLSMKFENVQDCDLAHIIESFRRQKLALENIPIRLKLVKTESTYVLILLMHHIITDATSTMLLEGYLSEAYNNSVDVTCMTPSLSYIDWASEERQKEREYIKLGQEFREFYKEITLNARRMSDVIDWIDEKAGSEGNYQVKRIVGKRYVNKTKHSLFVVIITNIARAMSSLIQKSTHTIIGAPYHNRTQNTKLVLGNFLNNIVVKAEYDLEVSYEDNLEKNKRNVAKSMKFCQVPTSFLYNNISNKSAFEIYINVRYGLESETNLKLEGCVSDKSHYELIKPTTHHQVECHVDDVEDGEVRMEWQSRNEISSLVNHVDQCMGGSNTKRTQLRDIFSQLLELTHFNDSDDFFDLGGNSLRLLKLKWMIKTTLGIDLSEKLLLKGCSVDSILMNPPMTDNVRVLIRGNDNVVIVLFHALLPGSHYYDNLIQEMTEIDPNVTVVFVDHPSEIPQSLTELARMAADKLKVLFSTLNPGEVIFVGFSFGALLAFETGQTMDKPYRRLVSLDGIGNSDEVNRDLKLEDHREQVSDILKSMSVELDQLDPECWFDVSWRLLQLSIRHPLTPTRAARCAEFVLIKTQAKDYGWPPMARARLLSLPVPHQALLQQPAVRTVARSCFSSRDPAADSAAVQVSLGPISSRACANSD